MRNKNVQMTTKALCLCNIIILVWASLLLGEEPRQTSIAEEIKPSEEAASPLKEEEKIQNLVVIHTNFGDIIVQLYPEKAPITVENFLMYVREGFYDSLIFHRVIDGFMIQGGGFDQNYEQKKPTYPPIKNEAANGLSNVTGTVAMARTNQIHSATTQFFINVNDNLYLDHRDNTPAGYGYAVFGKVIDGMDVVNEIKKVPTEVNPKTGLADWPKEDVVIESIEIVE
jgi:cyclophilin family peptidyl-prolyl cis-trans isomerase